MMRLLRALSAQDIDEPFEVVVVDDVLGSDDTLSRLRAAAPDLPFELVVFESRGQHGAGRRATCGWRKASAA